MKILYYDWDSLAQQDMLETLRKCGNFITLTTCKCDNYEKDLKFEQYLLRHLESENFDAVFSFNYFPVISKVCQVKNIRYISWIFDSPHLNLFSKTITNSCNRIFHFDGYIYNELKNYGVRFNYHMPLAVNTARLDKICCTKEEEKKFEADLSFVGRLYDKKNFYDQINYLSDYLKGYFNGIMQAQTLIYGYNFLEEMLTPDIMNDVKKYVKLDLGNDFYFSEKFVFANLFLGQKVTCIERIKLLGYLSEYMRVNLYSDSVENLLENVIHKGCIDSEITAPKVFRSSKINLNISLKTIQTGIPLRVFDILGAGGFLISNYQSELCDLFEVGEEIIIYQNAEDLLEKAKYYLEHEQERLNIKERAYQKVKENHTFDIRIKKILEIAF